MIEISCEHADEELKITIKGLLLNHMESWCEERSITYTWNEVLDTSVIPLHTLLMIS